jgi:uncharacterized protein YbgA (DUF1722 family)/uncharacterized protein YbbK (DUF523 family)
MREPAPIRVGVSACLLGHAVRYDGGHKRSRFVTDDLAEFVEWVPFCPELEAGLGVPRPAMRLVDSGGTTRLIEIASGRDHTVTLERASQRRCDELAPLDLSGAILKKDSPSCGRQRVKLYRSDGMPVRDGVGLFARRLMARFPNLPVEDEGRLNDAVLRENFIERVFAYRRVRDLFTGPWSSGDVVAFHTHHKLQLMAHSRVIYNEIGRLVARVAEVEHGAFAQEYEARFMAGMAIPATRGGNTNVLQHAAGHLKRLDADARAELSDLIHDYRLGLVPLVVPVTLLRHHTRAHDVTYLNGQTFLEPHPRELMLRNHV